MLQRLIAHWVYGTACCAVLLLVLSPALLAGAGPIFIAAFLHLPAYMLHQVEEHDRDRFRLFFNATLGHGLEVLSPAAVFVTNVPVVWGLLAVALLGTRVDPGWALLSAYLVLVNGAVHLAHAIAFRSYNPGLVTALAVFFPLGATTVAMVQRAGAGSLGWHLAGLGTAVAVHAAIIVHVRRRAAALGRA